MMTSTTENNEDNSFRYYDIVFITYRIDMSHSC